MVCSGTQPLDSSGAKQHHSLDRHITDCRLGRFRGNHFWTRWDTQYLGFALITLSFRELTDVKLHRVSLAVEVSRERPCGPSTPPPELGHGTLRCPEICELLD
ncbi:hypothetical protein VTK56DRAFT_408 [Thermocarpiscus australiensis]